MSGKLILLALAGILLSSGLLYAQGFQPPSEGKAVVYFTRVTGFGASTNFEFFVNDKFVGDLKGKNYLRLELDPGSPLIWASSENKEFLTTELEAGKTYVVMVDVIIGAWKAHVGLRPIDETKTEDFQRATELIAKNSPYTTSEKKIEARNEKLEKFIQEELTHYREVTKEERNFKHISSDMAIPEDNLN